MVASIEACVIVALAVVVFAPASRAPRHGISGLGASVPAASSDRKQDAPVAVDLDALREVVRGELEARDARRNGMSSAPPPRDLALDHLRKTRFHHQLDDVLRKGEMAQQELEALQEQATLLAERDQDAALSRLARAINTEQLRLRP